MNTDRKGGKVDEKESVVGNGCSHGVPFGVQCCECEKTNEAETNAAIAKALGWEEKESWTLQGRIRTMFYWWHRPTDERAVYAPSYSTDANTRPEMLAALTEEEKQRLCELHLGAESKHSNYGFNTIGLTLILELTQPQFARLWLEVKEK